MHTTMKLTSFGFVELAENFLHDALSAPPVGGGSWGFQRSVNFNDRSSSLQVIITSPAGITKTKVSIQARQTGTNKDYSIQGWTELPGQDKRTNFVLKESNPYRIEEEVFEIVDRLLADIPERDESAAFERPAPQPKSTFTPLIPEIQNTPAAPEPAPSAESGEPSLSPEAFDSTQSFVDALLSPDNFDKGPLVEEPAAQTTPEPVPEEPAAPAETATEETAPKAKSAKAKKPAK